MLHDKYVLKNTKTNNFIAIDTYSGGYPYEVAVEKAKIWYDAEGKEEALRYKDMFYKGSFESKDWELHKLLISTIKVK